MKRLWIAAPVLMLAMAPFRGMAQRIPSVADYNVAEDGPIPPELAHPGTIFISNGNSFFAPFTWYYHGDTSLAYVEFYQALKASGAYHLVSQPDQADLVVVVTTGGAISPAGNSYLTASSDLHLQIIDRRTNIPIWAMDQPVFFAFRHKNRNRNYERAMVRLIGQFEAFTGVAASPPKSTKSH